MHFVVFGGEEPAIGYYQGKVRGTHAHLRSYRKAR